MFVLISQNLLLGTLKVAFNDLLHAMILILLLMGFFAGIGHWRFGSTRADFSSFSRARPLSRTVYSLPCLIVFEMSLVPTMCDRI